jgi:hypothetical protein
MRFSPLPQRNARGISYATWENMVRQVRKLLNVKFDSAYFTVSNNANGIFVGVRAGGKSAANDRTFKTTISGKNCNVSAGTLRLHSIGTYPLPDTIIGLSGNPCWVYISHLRSHTSTSIKVSTSEPISTTTELMIPLCKCILSADGTSYSKAFTCWEMDPQFDTPIMQGGL